MNQLQALLDEVIAESLRQIILSNPTKKDEIQKIRIEPMLLKEELFYQECQYKGKQVFHRNDTANELKEHMLSYLQSQFKQCEIKTTEENVMILVSKKGTVTIKRKKETEAVDKQAIRSHNREKNYILKEGVPVDFLVGLGVQNSTGQVVKSKYDKFRQINRYLEFVEDVLEELPKNRTLRIIDFGCGKSYLTFAMYYFLHELKGYQVDMIGLDLKTDVIEHCNQLAKEYHYDSLRFEMGDISHYEGSSQVDMVVTLHACDTATDYAIEKAVKWGAKVIMTVPCCQHEVNKQIKCEELQQILKYGLIKERISALITDAIRANLLEEMGYATQILEFIDMEHTPKNLLIRAVKKEGFHPKKKDVKEVTRFLNITPTLSELLENK